MSSRFNSLSSKVIGIFLLLTVLSVGLLNVLAYSTSSTVFEAQTLGSMTSTLTFRGDILTEQLSQLENQATSIAKIESLQQAMTAMKSGWNTIAKTSGDAGKELRDVFITRNPNPGEPEKLLKPEGPSGFYYSSHETVQAQVAGFLNNTQFHDLLIVDQTGNVIYSYRKGDSFAENVASGALAASGLGRAFARAAEEGGKAVDDVAPTRFSGLRAGAVPQSPDIYFAVPVVKFGAFKGAILFQLKDTAITSILSKGIVSGSGERAAVLSEDGTGISLAEDGKLVDIEAAPFGFAKDAIQGEKITIASFQRADGTANAYGRPVSYGGDRYLVVESLTHAELGAGSWHIATTLFVTAIAVLAVMSIATGYLTGRLFAPLARLATVTGDVANGKLDEPVANQQRRDEIGSMAKALESFRLGLIEQQRLESESRSERERADAERRQRMAERETEAQSLQAVVAALDQGLDRLAGGDLAFEIRSIFPQELESLRHNFNKALSTLSMTLAGIGGNSVAVREGSDEMRSGADQLAERTERQAAALTQTASAIKAITDGVRTQIARAEDAERIARNAKDETEQSGRVMRETIAAMEAIQASSQEINQIISVIDEIAFQTNLLALNAGVEAARAGDSGKGFAVVAQEVRELAQRSATAAKQIAGLLSKSTTEVEHGVTLVEKAGAALEGVGTHVVAINGRISEIMSSTREEAQTLSEINGSVSQLDAMTQQNAAMVEETTAAIHRLAQEAGEMDQRLGQFSLGGVQSSDHAGVHGVPRARLAG
ncbi:MULTISPECIES: methyl-accepting chemotaxis protein [Alphaproteobacteria]|uniref:Methyl-accepting chemotaxis protein n=2 Tax=Alphaproteobacteria TaxID=28211 RepID=A0A512HPD5_9HYPH|nr:MULTISPECIES: methyl-accepting chemotaxis protein [Alphaproteobacteria]GEO87314.1 methyl-accepting chemotaxis protein [Ciceribacter naphthalenivorans]GLR22758.1 methyl-accepting chemotaxis protein [Ciceribacter naphthalenivorans]GLT05614.1 methyl-accepting chemotaxis protein [Sphingomonas psychrolutea]